MNPANWLTLRRSVRFSDTDAAGVVHFQALLGWAHQAWEESLERYGLAAGTIFPGGREGMPGIALPIVHCDADFRAPLQMGDVVSIQLEPKRLDRGSFEVVSRYRLGENEVARGCPPGFRGRWSPQPGRSAPGFPPRPDGPSPAGPENALPPRHRCR